MSHVKGVIDSIVLPTSFHSNNKSIPHILSHKLHDLYKECIRKAETPFSEGVLSISKVLQAFLAYLSISHCNEIDK